MDLLLVLFSWLQILDKKNFNVLPHRKIFHDFFFLKKGSSIRTKGLGATAVVEGIGDHGCEYMTGGIALILGETGRNFAAGMSGGIAYLYSPDGTFDEKKFNLEMVELEDLTDQDKETVQGLLQNHNDYTNSSKAANILKDWPDSSKNFIKVMPTDYKNALAMLAAEEENKLNA